jgi:hypothetical protein
MKQIRVPTHWNGREALSVVAFLETIIDALWRQHGLVMACALEDDRDAPTRRARRPHPRHLQQPLPFDPDTDPF